MELLSSSLFTPRLDSPVCCCLLSEADPKTSRKNSLFIGKTRDQDQVHIGEEGGTGQGWNYEKEAKNRHGRYKCRYDTAD